MHTGSKVGSSFIICSCHEGKLACANYLCSRAVQVNEVRFGILKATQGRADKWIKVVCLCFTASEVRPYDGIAMYVCMYVYYYYYPCQGSKVFISDHP